MANATGMAQPGKKVRDTTVVVTDGKKVKLSSLVGRKGLVLYFYPKDMTPGCTTESCDFRDNLARLKQLGYGVAGVSADDADRHRKFTDKHELSFPLIADTEQKLCNVFGVWQKKKLYGKSFMGIVRSTFVLDKTLKVILAFEKVKVKGHVDALIEAVVGGQS